MRADQSRWARLRSSTYVNGSAMVDSVGMAAFEPGSELNHDLDWDLVQDGFVAMFWDRDRLQEALDWLTNHG